MSVVSGKDLLMGATKAFPGYRFDDLFYVDSEKSPNE